MLLSSSKARLITFFKTRLIKNLSQQLTRDRSYISVIFREHGGGRTIFRVTIRNKQGSP